MPLAFVLSLLIGLGISPAARSIPSHPPLFFTPIESTASREVIKGIESAQHTLHMTMFRVTHPEVLEALIAARARGVVVKVLIDKATARFEKPTGPSFKLRQGGVEVVQSTSKFSITHSKTFVVDSTSAYIMTLNLTRIPQVVRDVGIITEEPETVEYLEKLFAADWHNALNDDNQTPPDIPDNLVVAPVDASEKLRALIRNAKKTLQVVAENLSHHEVINELIKAHIRGVKVQVLLPRCNFSKQDFNIPAAQDLNQSGIDVRMMPDPEGRDLPYIHQKSISADSRVAFIGSENFSYNSIERARELGIVFRDIYQIRQLDKVFNEDFAKALPLKEALQRNCID